jgi:hypothetical protein
MRSGQGGQGRGKVLTATSNSPGASRWGFRLLGGATVDNTRPLRTRVLSWLIDGGNHGQHHTADHHFVDNNSVWRRLLRAGPLVVNRLRTVGGQTPSDLRRKKAFWIGLCVWGVGAVALWWLGRRYVSETTEALFAGAGFLVGFFYIFALGAISDLIERRLQHIPQVAGRGAGRVDTGTHQDAVRDA